MYTSELHRLIWDTLPHLTSTVVDGEACLVKRTWKPLDPTVEDDHLVITMEDIPAEEVYDLGAPGVTDIDIASVLARYHLPLRVRVKDGSVPFTRQMAEGIFRMSWKVV